MKKTIQSQNYECSVGLKNIAQTVKFCYSELYTPRTVREEEIALYRSACRKFGVVPCGCVLEKLGTEELDVSHRTLSPLDVKALMVALMVSQNIL